MLGWMFDSMDFLIYVLAIGHLKQYFNFGDSTAGLLGTLTLVSAAVGVGQRIILPPSPWPIASAPR